jgi:hypothetical protein
MSNATTRTPPTPAPSSSPPPPTSTPPRRHTSDLTPDEQGALLEDYFNNSVDLATVASNARLRLLDLAEWLASPSIQAKLDLIKAADLERAQRIAAHHAAIAMQSIAFIARQSPESDRSMETVRKAATYIHRAAQPPKLDAGSRRRDTGKQQSPPEPSQSDATHTGGPHSQAPLPEREDPNISTQSGDDPKAPTHPSRPPTSNRPRQPIEPAHAGPKGPPASSPPGHHAAA